MGKIGGLEKLKKLEEAGRSVQSQQHPRPRTRGGFQPVSSVHGAQARQAKTLYDDGKAAALQVRGAEGA